MLVVLAAQEAMAISYLAFRNARNSIENWQEAKRWSQNALGLCPSRHLRLGERKVQYQEEPNDT